MQKEECISDINGYSELTEMSFTSAILITMIRDATLTMIELTFSTLEIDTSPRALGYHDGISWFRIQLVNWENERHHCEPSFMEWVATTLSFSSEFAFSGLSTPLVKEMFKWFYFVNIT